MVMVKKGTGDYFAYSSKHIDIANKLKIYWQVSKLFILDKDLVARSCSSTSSCTMPRGSAPWGTRSTFLARKSTEKLSLY